MVYAAVNEHLPVVTALLDTLFPALPDEAEAARAAGRDAEAIFLDSPGGKEPRIAQLVEYINLCLPMNCVKLHKLIFWACLSRQSHPLCCRFLKQ